MKYRFFTIFVMVAIIIGCANQRTIYHEYKPEQKIHYSQMKHIENMSDYAFYLDKGGEIPVKLVSYTDIHAAAKAFGIKG